ncbi:cordon-bleu protein-like 1b isoform X2 [Astyanax mexicanus]|uniref:cordon-bleu protein-like 1b isoform X2 n=1 Tax=Astyanax mexicanus TaxID=7994 RepID=UPI0020CB45AF|nr:cordon-bleu protein-like 1b isoform X2 [Astyanax mexicanus]
MRVDNRAEDHWRSGPRVNPVQPSVSMDGDDQQDSPHRCPSDTRRSSKSKAPPPPPVLHGVCVSPHTAMDQKENLLEQELLLTVVLPEGVEKTTVVHGSKPMMDLLVMLCAKYHLNPSGHTIELVSTNRNHIKFKPNALIGSLEAEKVLLKPKGMEDKNKKTGPQMPEATVRMVINYKKTQKTILRVNPRIPLQELLPAICEKCEFEPRSTVLLRNVHSEDPLDLSSSLNELGLREVYARDTRGMDRNSFISQESFPPSPTHSDIIQPGKDKLQKEKENKGLFGLFKRGSKKKQEQSSTVSAPASPVHRKQRPVSMSALSTHSPTYDSNTMPSDTPKKRRAPLPPQMISSQGLPSDLNQQTSNVQPITQPDGNQVTAALSRSSSTGSSLKRSKRKAPPPPTSPSSLSAAPDEAPQDRAVTGLPSALEEIQEKEETPMTTEALVTPVSSSPISPSPESPSPVQELLEDDSSINLSADISMDSGRAGTASPSQDSEEVEIVAPPGGSTEDVSCDLTTDGKLDVECKVNGHRAETDDVFLQPGDKADFEKWTEEASSATEKHKVMKDECTSTVDVTQEETLQDPASSRTHAVTYTQQAEPQAPPRPGPAAASGQAAQDASPTVFSLSHTHAQIQTETWCTSTELKPKSSPKELTSAVPLASSSLKRDMATSTEELHTQEVHSPETQSSMHTHAPESHSSIQTQVSERQTPTHSQTLEGNLSSPIPSATTAGNLQYITESEPKPKPSNELTRNYIPKVGMTTYTIVPQRSLDKLRFFEVELTLESPSKTEAQEVSTEGTERLDDPPRITSHATAPPQSTNGLAAPLSSSSSELSHSIPSSPASPEADGSAFTADQEGHEVKEKKVPPATRPKPASFRLPQHKRTPGSYVSSAAVRSLSVSDSGSSSTAGGSHWEALGSLWRDSYPGVTQNFPPSPPPAQWENEKETVEVQQASLSQTPLKQEEPQKPIAAFFPKESEVSGETRHSQLPCQMSQPTAGLSLEKLRSFAAPKPYSPTTQSRFAQAVSSAVKRAQSLSTSPVGQEYGRKVPLALTKRSTFGGSLDLPESPTSPDLDSEYGQRKAVSETWTPPEGCSDPAQGSPHTEAPHTEGTLKNGTTDLSSGCVMSPVTGPAPSLQDAAQCQEE